MACITCLLQPLSFALCFPILSSFLHSSWASRQSVQLHCNTFGSSSACLQYSLGVAFHQLWSCLSGVALLATSVAFQGHIARSGACTQCRIPLHSHFCVISSLQSHQTCSLRQLTIYSCTPNINVQFHMLLVHDCWNISLF